MNSKKFAEMVLPFLKKYNTYSHKEELLIIYGLQTLYILITKMILITIFSIILGITKEMYIFIIFYGLLRFFSSGLHLSSSLGCTILSSFMLIGIPELVIHTNIIFEYRILITGLVLVIFALYSPADTIKKPLIHEEKRIKNKIISSVLCYIYLILTLIIKDRIILNYITYALMLQSFLIMPITYKIFNQPYNNYLNYKADN